MHVHTEVRGEHLDSSPITPDCIPLSRGLIKLRAHYFLARLAGQLASVILLTPPVFLITPGLIDVRGVLRGSGDLNVGLHVCASGVLNY